ncbi:Avr9/Cf-9 rapidly elicited protein 75 [Striga asiatica]|uniref:Avr9/Cf-9 rapidly elicited protein 75 n=1 Tax=Striga asiatica TaxID=4170 RepID=A0A5A7P0S8_STRAF|nr:Avr9/Cf-9 rapidly elicited protein 75 [Striga asiatica]
MAWSESQVICRQHPDEIPQPGVCPACLRQRLSKIIAGNSRLLTGDHNYYYSPDSPSISGSPAYIYGCSDSGGFSSPAVERLRRGRRRIASDVMDSIYLAISGNVIGNGLNKSRSMAFASRSVLGDGDGDGGGVNRKKKLGFWNKLLLRTTGRKSKF